MAVFQPTIDLTLESPTETTMQGDAGRSAHRIRNIPVHFPFPPYDCQLEYMEKVIRALQEGSNAVLESPTGTGKTLCLLCAALAWREEQVRITNEQLMDSNAATVNPFGEMVTVSRIIYASRTHSQLTQVINELKNTIYRPKVALLGSREQMCINPEVMKRETNAEKTHLCKSMVRSRRCHYHSNVKSNNLPETIMDIEDIVKAGSKNKVCPYYFSINKMDAADIIFMPYNYIIDIKTRQLHGIDIKGAVIILDEAHNIGSVCEESTSFTITSIDLAHCVEDTDYVLRQRMKEIREHSTEQEDSDNTGDLRDEIQDFVNLKKIFLTLEETLNKIANRDSVTKPGSFIYEYYQTAGINYQTYPTLAEQCDKAITFLTTCGQSVFKSGNHIQQFLDTIKIAFDCCSPEEVSVNYKVHLVETTKTKNQMSDRDVWKSSSSNDKTICSIQFMCFTPGYAMMNMKEQEVRSVIITSGTLSPLDGFCTELKLEFPIQHQGSHVVSRDQVHMSILKKGCDSCCLNSSWKFRFTNEFNISRIVPDGMLVFFPSYAALYSCFETWEEKGVLRQMEQIKAVFKEPKRKTELNHIMEAYCEAVRNPKGNGAMLFAVCRGKISEGLDFSDAMGRTVLVTGIPFAPREDPKVKLKLQYLRERFNGSTHSRGIHPEAAYQKMQWSEDWYRQQAIRAVNQAIGRVIRHKQDYGAIILCDERFDNKGNKEELSPWIQSYIRVHEAYGMFQKELKAFFRHANQVYGGKEIVNAEGDAKMKVANKSHLIMKASEPPNRPISVPVASLAKLDEQASANGPSPSLMDALQRTESKSVIQDTPHYGDTKAMPIDLTQYSSASSSYLDLSKQLKPSPSMQCSSSRKKIKIVQKPPIQSNVPGDFLVTLKENLSHESFQKLKEAVKFYKGGGHFDEFFCKLKEVFNHPSLYKLLKGIAKFVKSNDLNMFYEYYMEFTRDHRPVDRKRVDCSDTNDSQSKRIKS